MCVCLACIAYKWAAAAPNWRQDIGRDRERERGERGVGGSGRECERVFEGVRERYCQSALSL